MVYGDSLENCCTATYRGFESLTLRILGEVEVFSNINYLTFTTMKTISEEFERLLRETARIQEECLAVAEEIKQLLKSYKSNCNHSETEE